ncbi:TIM barrel protein [Actinomadura rupiterrae]|uniref:TIM barrel protein n=1 Tax=Actinomadura rupiterrae TaxID=559627 RepID=UPI0020A4945A|nr:TIM barrel protein [Actinomadura rupiterrae]MCP2336276.1 inosose dehydratase [Actinomadura rupiterrae]
MTARSAVKVAGAPISWGVCEVPGWGHQLAPGRVLDELAALGLDAVERGPDGFLPDDPDERDALLKQHGLRLVGAFVPVVLHDPDDDPLGEIATALDALPAETVLVLAAATGLTGYDTRPALGPDEWRTLLANLDAATRHAEARGRTITLHPHVGTVVERKDEVARVLDGCAVPLCLDTGHLLVGGTDPVALTREAAARIGHVHLKDVDVTLARQVQAGERPYAEAVASGLYRPLGQGGVNVEAIVRALTDAGYDGWYVLEQDAVLTEEPPTGRGPVEEVAASLAYLTGIAP